MCTPHVRINQNQFDTVLELLHTAREHCVKAASIDNKDFLSAMEAQLAVQSAIIHLEVVQDGCSFASGFTDPDVQAAQDELTLITHRNTFSPKTELSAELANV